MYNNNKKKMIDIMNLLSIIKKLKGDDIIFLYSNLNQYSKDILGECVDNLLHNTNNLKLTQHQLNRVRKKIFPFRKYLEYIAKNGKSQTMRCKAVKQVGGGVFTSLASLLLPTIISLISKK